MVTDTLLLQVELRKWTSVRPCILVFQGSNPACQAHDYQDSVTSMVAFSDHEGAASNTQNSYCRDGDKTPKTHHLYLCEDPKSSAQLGQAAIPRPALSAEELEEERLTLGGGA